MRKIPCVGIVCCACAGTAVSLPAQVTPPPGIPGVQTRVGLELFGAELTQTLRGDGFERLRLSALVDPRGAYELALEGRAGGWSPGWAPGFRILVTSLDRRRFYGYGNATATTLPSAAYEIRPLEASVHAGLSYESLWLRARLGPELRHVETRLDLDDDDEPGEPGEPDELRPAIFEMRPYGIGSFTQVGLLGELELRTDRPSSEARAGASLELSGRWSPAALDVETSYGAVTAEAAVFYRAPLPGSPLLAWRAGVEHAGSGAPYFDAAYLGGFDRLRGLRSQRYAGRTAVWTGVEGRLRLGGATVRGTPLDFGTTLFADVGRISWDGDPASPLRSGFGGGLWVGTDGGPSLSLTAARAEGSTRIYLKFGLFGWN